MAVDVKWYCAGCGRVFDTQDQAYKKGCGTWSVAVLADSIKRHPITGNVVEATIAGRIASLSVSAKVTL